MYPRQNVNISERRQWDRLLNAFAKERVVSVSDLFFARCHWPIPKLPLQVLRVRALWITSHAVHFDDSKDNVYSIEKTR